MRKEMEQILLSIIEEIAKIEDEVAEKNNHTGRNYFDGMSDATQVVREKIKQLKYGNY